MCVHHTLSYPTFDRDTLCKFALVWYNIYFLNLFGWHFILNIQFSNLEMIFFYQISSNLPKISCILYKELIEYIFVSSIFICFIIFYTYRQTKIQDGWEKKMHINKVKRFKLILTIRPCVPRIRQRFGKVPPRPCRCRSVVRCLQHPHFGIPISISMPKIPSKYFFLI